jgi:hypothetical protein
VDFKILASTTHNGLHFCPLAFASVVSYYYGSESLKVRHKNWVFHTCESPCPLAIFCKKMIENFTACCYGEALDLSESIFNILLGQKCKKGPKYETKLAVTLRAGSQLLFFQFLQVAHAFGHILVQVA